LEILTKLQRKILLRFSELPDKDAFYLTGGTALAAIFLKHRRSNDLDFFTPVEELIVPLSQKLEVSLIEEGFRVERLRGFHSFVELSVRSDNDSTVVHFALDSPFRFEQPSDFDEIPGVKVDSLIDIATNKLLALFGRAELRDFVDIYFLVKEHFNKNELIQKAFQKDPGFDLYWFGIAMERIRDFADDSPDLHLLARPCTMNELKEFFSNWIRDILKEITEKE
jgi:predicted nucleotidyltransferase component of viral defense system